MEDENQNTGIPSDEMKPTPELEADPDNYEYSTSVEHSLLLMREIEKIHFCARMKHIATTTAKALMEAGVDFSKVDFSKVTEPSCDELFSLLEG